MGWFSSPSKIDPFQIRDLMESDYTTKLDNLATEITDQSSGYNQDLLQNAMEISGDQTYTQNRINRMNTAMTGGNQSGIMNQVNNQNVATSQGNVVEDWFKQMMNNKQTQIGILQGNQQVDSQIGEAQASAYGQNITNKNNYNSAMAGNVMGIASSFLCDAKMKENIKKVGKIKAKNGKHVGLYQFNYKGRDKQHTSVIAQDVMKTLPDAVHKGKNGLLYVDMNKVI